jgi:hypothetical protein
MSRKRKVTATPPGYSNNQVKDPVIMSVVATAASWKGKFSSPVNDGSGAFNASAGIVDQNAIIFATTGNIDQMYVEGNIATTGSGETFTLYVNGVARTLTVTVPATATTGSDTSHRTVINAGDTVSIYYASGSAGTFVEVAVSVRFIPT